MATDGYRLVLTFDGTVRGMREHRLSLAEFQTALKELLHAFRRIGSFIVTNASSADPSTSSRGRLAARARELDLQIETVSSGSDLSVAFICARVEEDDAQNAFPFARLLERTTMEFLESVRDESRGDLRNQSVRQFLRALPQGIQRQRYAAYRDSTPESLILSVEVGELNLPEMNAPESDDVPEIISVDGVVGAIDLDPSKRSVRIDSDARTISLLATEEQVERAWSLRGETICALAVTRPGSLARLLRLGASSTTLSVRSAEATRRRITERWHDVLTELAK